MCFREGSFAPAPIVSRWDSRFQMISIIKPGPVDIVDTSAGPPGVMHPPHTPGPLLEAASLAPWARRVEGFTLASTDEESTYGDDWGMVHDIWLYPQHTLNVLEPDFGNIYGKTSFVEMLECCHLCHVLSFG